MTLPLGFINANEELFREFVKETLPPDENIDQAVREVEENLDRLSNGMDLSGGY